MPADSQRYRFSGRCRTIHAGAQLPEAFRSTSPRRDGAGKPPLCTGRSRATLVVMNPGHAVVDCGFDLSPLLSRIAARRAAASAFGRLSACRTGRPGGPATPSGRCNCSRRCRLRSGADMRCPTSLVPPDSASCGDACRRVVGLRSTMRYASSAGARRRTNATTVEGVRVRRSLFRLPVRAVAGRRRAAADRATAAAAAAAIPSGAGVLDAGWRVAVFRRTMKTVAPASMGRHSGSSAAGRER